MSGTPCDVPLPRNVNANAMRLAAQVIRNKNSGEQKARCAAPGYCSNWKKRFTPDGFFVLREASDCGKLAGNHWVMRTVFISYSHTDEAWKDKLLPHLQTLEKAGVE